MCMFVYMFAWPSVPLYICVHVYYDFSSCSYVNGLYIELISYL